MPSRRRNFILQLHQLGDALLIAGVFWLAHAVREWLAYEFPLQFAGIAPFRYYKWLYLVILPVFPFILDINGYYTRQWARPLRHTLGILARSVAISALVVVATMYFFRTSGLSRGVILLFAASSLGALYLKDLLLAAYRKAPARRAANARPVILVGPPDRNAEFTRLLEARQDWQLRIVATLDPTQQSLNQLPALLHRQPVACVIFNVGQTYFTDVEQAILACEVEGVEAWLFTDFVKTSIAHTAIDEFHGKPVLVFRTAPDFSGQLLIKRLIDFVGAACGLLIVGPLVMVPVAIAIRLTSAGPIFFRQRRSGLQGQQFTMLKFRTMVSNAEMLRAELEAFNEVTGPVFKMQRDPRVTPLGRFLRRSSIDELPQLWNVLCGDMSLVGPRPPIPSEVEQYDPWHRRRLSMKPGLTCLWQISGRSQLSFDQWMKLDLQYIDTWSLWLDLKILLHTIPVVLRGIGAH
jgi:exopolysaccharide biosynthesis polyprenyl glycosylphosphotransferase